MEENVFHRPEVLRELKKFVEVRLHTDVVAEWSEKLHDLKLQRLEGDESLPYYEIVDPTTERTLGKFRGADITGRKFIEFLKRALESQG